MADTLNDYMYQYYSRLVTGNAALSGAINVSRAAVGVEATTAFTGGGTPVVAPAANASIAQIAGLTSGTYEVEITTFISGTTVASLESSNMNFRIGGVANGVILTPVPGTSGANACGIFRTRINVVGPITISVNAIAAATAASNYVASIVAQKIGF
jgi:hypothetical protein